MTAETLKDFPALFCRELARCTHGQMQLVLTDRADLSSASLPSHKRILEIPVQGGLNSSGMLILLSSSQEPDDWYPLQETQMVADPCGLILWAFEFVSSASLPAHRPDVRDLASLTEQEREVLLFMCRGLRPQDMAQRLKVKGESVDRYKRQVRTKLRAEHDLQVPLVAFLSGLFSPLTDLRDEND